MKQKVKFSIYSIITTAVVLILCVARIFSLLDNPSELLLFCIIIMGSGTIAGLYYCPKSVEADNSAITLHRLFLLQKAG